ncbi:MAG TPA: hypothetical protein VLC74_06890 [Rhizomicrobium sp.]|nr:hypothetical protein [Rhizomicrobium sp.]
MRLFKAAAIGFLLAAPAQADTRENCATAWQNMPAPDRGAMTHAEWWAKCTRASYTVGEYNAPSYATAICKDGHYSRRKPTEHRCIHHGGVQTPL